MLINPNDFIFNENSGRVFRRSMYKITSLIIHKVIYIGVNIYDNQEYVVDFTGHSNLRIITFQEFEKVFKSYIDNNYDKRLLKQGFLPILLRLNNFDINTKYEFYRYNCHNFVDDMYGYCYFPLKNLMLGIISSGYLRITMGILITLFILTFFK
jgi:hypothetical protein